MIRLMIPLFVDHTKGVTVVRAVMVTRVSCVGEHRVRRREGSDALDTRMRPACRDIDDLGHPITDDGDAPPVARP